MGEKESEKEIDVERSYTPAQTADKLRRIAEAIESGESFRIQVGGNRISVPADAKVEIEMQTRSTNAVPISESPALTRALISAWCSHGDDQRS